MGKVEAYGIIARLVQSMEQHTVNIPALSFQNRERQGRGTRAWIERKSESGD
jgi:hypothetical protein